MTTLVLGLLLFLGVHSLRIVADDWRARQIQRMGLLAWKASYALFSLAGLLLIVTGYAALRQQPVVLWTSPLWLRHLAVALNLIAFVLLIAAYVPGNALKVRLQHPMVLGVKVWALAHLLANGTLAGLLLFGSFLVWAILDFRSARRRPVSAPPPAVHAISTLLTVFAGLAAGLAFARWGHIALIGVAPLG